MPVCYGVQSFVMASRAPIFHACSVDLSWQTTVHACQRCPRAAMTPSAATAAIATQSNMEGTTSRFCPAGVHMGKCLPAQEVYTETWGSVSNISSALGSGLVPRLSQRFTDSSKSPDALIPTPSVIEPWVPPDLPLPTTVHSKASFSPTVPIAVQSPLPEDNASTPSGGASAKHQKITQSKSSEDNAPSSASKTLESVEKVAPAAKIPLNVESNEASVSPPETSPASHEDAFIAKVTETPMTQKTSTIIPASKTENASASPAVNSSVSVATISPIKSVTVSNDVDKSNTTKGYVRSKEETSATSSSVSTFPSRFEDDESKENFPKAAEEKGKEEKRKTEVEAQAEDETTEEVPKKVPKKFPSEGFSPSALKPLQSAKHVPQFYIPMGRSTLSSTELCSVLEKVKTRILEGLTAPPPAQEKVEEAERNDNKNAENQLVTAGTMDEEKKDQILIDRPTVESSVPFSLFGVVAKACGCPLYWKRALFTAAGGEKDSTAVSVKAILSLWRRVLEICPDTASQFIYLLTRGKAQYLIPEDFWPIIQDVVDTHPSLTFLQAAPEFHARYVTTVVSRIFFCANTSWSGRISLGELRRSNFLDVLASLETEEDINLVTQYFSYEHFYVIYCKFWELDTNHDLIISKADLSRHNNYAISERMIDRIFSGAVTRGTSFKEGTMSYSDFVWFLLAEEDKRHPRSIEYWFRCMDLDGDGVLSLYELEYFYSEQSARMEEMGIEPPTLEDCLCQCLDMVRPALPDKIRLSDLKKCSLCPVFFDTFFNLPKYLQHEQRDPFSNLQAIEEGLTEVSDWDRYASDTYEMLIASENGGGGAGGGDDDDEEEEDLIASSPVHCAENEALTVSSSEKSAVLGEASSPSVMETPESSPSVLAQSSAIVAEGTNELT